MNHKENDIVQLKSNEQFILINMVDDLNGFYFGESESGDFYQFSDIDCL